MFLFIFRISSCEQDGGVRKEVAREEEVQDGRKAGDLEQILDDETGRRGHRFGRERGAKRAAVETPEEGLQDAPDPRRQGLVVQERRRAHRRRVAGSAEETTPVELLQTVPSARPRPHVRSLLLLLLRPRAGDREAKPPFAMLVLHPHRQRWGIQENLRRGLRFVHRPASAHSDRRLSVRRNSPAPQHSPPGHDHHAGGMRAAQDVEGRLQQHSQVDHPSHVGPHPGRTAIVRVLRHVDPHGDTRMLRDIQNQRVQARQLGVVQVLGRRQLRLLRAERASADHRADGNDCEERRKRAHRLQADTKTGAHRRHVDQSRGRQRVGGCANQAPQRGEEREEQEHVQSLQNIREESESRVESGRANRS